MKAPSLSTVTEICLFLGGVPQHYFFNRGKPSCVQMEILSQGLFCTSNKYKMLKKKKTLAFFSIREMAIMTYVARDHSTLVSV